MYSEGSPDYFVNHGLYYPNAASYGYISSTGFESNGDVEDHPHMIVGLDGQEVQFTGVANENLPFVYYTPSYGYGQSPFNPYNPYIPGAMIGVDGSVGAGQQGYALPLYDNSISLPSYVPVVLQSRPDTVGNVVGNSMDNVASVDSVEGFVAKHSLRSTTSNSSVTVVGETVGQRNSLARVSEGVRANTGCGKQPVPSMTSGRFPSQASAQIPRVGRSSRGTNGFHGKTSSCETQLKNAFTTANASSGLESNNYSPVQKVKSKLSYGNESKNKLVVKAYTTKAGNPDPQGNITIFMDQYNKGDFPIDYVNAKFFVIKSYSEDDVHKSIKYNVWSSTPNGNKKLEVAYEDAQKICVGDSRRCPIFLFFSVNASGQFCGVAEMIGPVDFHRNMDFWQQDKWSASFPVKWHIIKDVPNLNFRHIILENNENKPVTNSRDAQEIFYKKGLEMLQIFKNYTARTSLLDDFLYYENRQQIIQAERSRYLVPLLEPPWKLQHVHDVPCSGNVNGDRPDPYSLIAVNSGIQADNKYSSLDKCAVAQGQVSLDPIATNLMGVDPSCHAVADRVPNAVDEFKMRSLAISSDKPEPDCPLPGGAPNSSQNELVNVVTIGSMPVKVPGTESSGVLTVGTIPLDPRVLHD